MKSLLWSHKTQKCSSLSQTQVTSEKFKIVNEPNVKNWKAKNLQI